MKRTLSILLLSAMAVVIAVPAFAGEGKCTASAQECLDYMANAYANKGWVGLEFDETYKDGMKISKVVAESPAEKAGFEVGDVFFALNGIEYAEENMEAMKAEQKKMVPGSKVLFTVMRGDHKKDLKVKLAEMPAHVKYAVIGGHMMDHANAEVAAGEHEGGSR